MKKSQGGIGVDLIGNERTILTPLNSCQSKENKCPAFDVETEKCAAVKVGARHNDRVDSAIKR